MRSIKRGLRAVVLLAPLFLAACATPIPKYQPTPEEKVTSVKLFGWGEPYMCRMGKLYALPVQEENGARRTTLPTGARVGLINFITVHGYQVVSRCTARASVVPRDGINLIVNGMLPEAGKCGLDVVREDGGKETGVSLEPSVGGPAC